MLNGLKGIKLWSLEEPHLYEIQVDLEVKGYSDRMLTGSVFGRLSFDRTALSERAAGQDCWFKPPSILPVCWVRHAAAGSGERW